MCQMQETASELFVHIFAEMNEKAIQAMDSEEPETALEYLKKVNETID